MDAMPRRRFRPFWHSGQDKEALQLFKEHSSTWAVEMQMLKYKVDNVCSQIQMLSGHLENTSADIRMVKGVLEDAGTCHIQTQMLRNSLEGAVAEIQGLRRALEKANTLNSQTQDFLQSSSENTSFALHMLSQDLEDANAEIQLLKLSMSSFSRIAVSSTVGACITFLMSRSVRRGLSSSVHPKELTWHWCPLRKSRFLSKEQLDNWQHRNGPTEDCVHTQQMCSDIYCDATYQWVCKKSVGHNVA
ncbi:C-type lectin domain family 4 member F-like isoform X5 [Dasypus novemcinctus]|uniref:C-type lectin domain family 4 member F-like isoform X5 n=1 Tax=Dasypus novemcinctus TaxID=9361 RepID=UPI00265E1E79|nr:C-type lectin domain family 4 member F-like isoform X4 [Dasypus novemcinctus]